MAKGGSHLRRDSQPPRRTDSRSARQTPTGSRPQSRTENRPQSRSSSRTENNRTPNPPQRRTENHKPQSQSQSRTGERVYVQPPRSDSRRTGQNPPPTPPRRKSSRRRRRGFPLWPVIVVLVAVIAFSLFMLGKTILGYTSNRSDYKGVQDAAIIPRLPETTPEADAEDTETNVIRSEVPFDVDWDMLRQTNSEVVAWLYCPDTVINYPVVQTTDNEKYLTVNFSGNYNAGGALFADYNSVIGIRSSHLIIYGHNMKDSSMFGTLQKFADEAYVKEHPVFYLLTPEQDYRVDLLDCLTIGATVDNYPNYFSESGSLETYVGRLSSMAYWVNSEADYQNHQLLTMSTCTGSDDERLILQGVLVPIE